MFSTFPGFNNIHWQNTALGSPETWPADLAQVINMCMQSKLPCALMVKNSGAFIYNDVWQLPADMAGEASFGADINTLNNKLIRQIAAKAHEALAANTIQVIMDVTQPFADGADSSCRHFNYLFTPVNTGGAAAVIINQHDVSISALSDITSKLFIALSAMDAQEMGVLQTADEYFDILEQYSALVCFAYVNINLSLPGGDSMFTRAFNLRNDELKALDAQGFSPQHGNIMHLHNVPHKPQPDGRTCTEGFALPLVLKTNALPGTMYIGFYGQPMHSEQQLALAKNVSNVFMAKLLAAISAQRNKLVHSTYKEEERKMLFNGGADSGIFEYNITTGALSSTERLGKYFDVEKIKEDPLKYLEHIMTAEGFADLKGKLRRAFINAPQMFSTYQSFYVGAGGRAVVMQLLVKLHEEPQTGHKILAGAFIDVTNSHKMASELKEANTRWALAMEAGRFGLAEYNVDRLVIRCDRQHLLNLGLDPDSRVDNEILKSTLSPEYIEVNNNKIVQAARTKQTFVVDYKLKPKDGVSHWVRLVGKPYPNAQEGNLTLLAISFDITEQKTHESRKDEFISTASHELKTPLTGIKAYNQLLEKIIKDPVPLNYIQKTARQINRLEKLINDMLDVNRIYSGRMKYQFTEFNVMDMVQEAVHNAQAAAGQRIHVTGNFARLFNGDRIRLAQVLDNLLSNAVKYSPGAAEITLNVYTEGEELVIAVKDDGIGMEPAVVESLFSRYYRADNISLTFEGLGLGLFIANEIVKEHNGRLEAESTVGEGSTFYIRLPLNGAAV